MPVTKLKHGDKVRYGLDSIEGEGTYVGDSVEGYLIIENTYGSLERWSAVNVRRRPVKVTKYMILETSGSMFSSRMYNTEEGIKAYMHDKFPEESYIIAKVEFEQ